MMQQKKIIFFIFYFSFSGCLHTAVYKSHVSDLWYQQRGKKLGRQLEQLENQASKRFNQKLNVHAIKAIVVPHAGFNDSGELASGVYKNLKPKIFDRVVILAPSHDTNFDGIALPGLEYAWYKNSLGYVQLDVNFLKKLKKISSLFFYNHHAHELEHAIEIQIPFIQKYCGTCKIIPLLVGNLHLDQIGHVATMLGNLLDKKTLVVVSSDLTHYGKVFGFTPFDHDVVANIFKLDQKLIEIIKNVDVHGFAKILNDTGDFVCGKNSILILLSMIQTKYFGDVCCHLVGYDHSVSDQKNPENCVSYIGMVITQEKL